VPALLIVNPHATATTQLRRDVITHALASQMDLEVVETRYRGHAGTLARQAASDGFQLILTLGGDGTVNEAVNGLLRGWRPGTDPAFAAVPGGNANVFTRALGLPADPVDATGRILEALRAGRDRRVGLGCATPGAPAPGGPTPAEATPAEATPAEATPGGPAPAEATPGAAAPGGPTPAEATPGRPAPAEATPGGATPAGGRDRYFTFNAGLGLDAEVVRVIEELRAHGRALTPGLYLRTALRQFYAVTDRRHPALTLEREGQSPVGHLFLGIISNTSPWTYLGPRPVNPSPGAGFDTGLDIFALRRMGTIATLNALRQMFAQRSEPPRGRHVVSLHDQPAFTLRSDHPVALQVDGEYVGEHESVTFRAVPRALRVIA
jgi:diacylglycerol kinase family enzyme